MSIAQIPPGTGSPGPKGDSGNFTYYGYATNASGAGFSLVPDATRKFVQILISATQLSPPVAGNFTGTWVQYIGDNGTNGSNGVNAYTYYAYASDTSGGDFTTTFDPVLPYVAVRSTTTPLTPVVGDFAGRWVRYIGINGTNGINGLDGIPGIGDLFRFSTPLSGDPGAGFFRLSDAGGTSNRIDLATKLFIDFFAQGGLDVSDFQTTWEPGGRLTIKTQASSSQKYGVYSLNSVSNQASHRVYDMSFVAGSAGVSFAANELVAISYTPVPIGDSIVTSSEILAADDFVRFFIEGANITGLMDEAGNKVLGINPEYTWANLAPLVNQLPKWSSVILAPADIGGTHRTKNPVRLVTDLVEWRPEGGRQQTHSAACQMSVAGGLATASGTTATKFAIAASPSFPANFFKIGMGLRIVAIFRKADADTNASNFSVRFGKFDSTANDIVGTEATTSVHTNKEIKIDTQFAFTVLGTAGTAKVLSNSLGANTAGGEVGSVLDRNVQLDTTVVQNVIFTAQCSANAAAVHELLAYYIEIVG